MSKIANLGLYTREDTCLRTTLSRSTLRELVLKDEFPKPVQIPGSRRIAWIAVEVEDWIANLKRASWPVTDRDNAEINQNYVRTELDAIIAKDAAEQGISVEKYRARNAAKLEAVKGASHE